MRNFFILTILVLIGSLVNLRTQALNASPNSGSLTPNSTITINLVASPPSGSTAMQLRITTTNLQIVNYTPPVTNWAPALTGAGCSSSYTATEVCVDLAKTTGDITAGESLGSIEVQVASTGTATISRDSDNGYLVGFSVQPNTGTAATYNIGAGSGPTTLPQTALFEGNNLIPAFIAVVVSLAICLVLISRMIFAQYFTNISRHNGK